MAINIRQLIEDPQRRERLRRRWERLPLALRRSYRVVDEFLSGRDVPEIDRARLAMRFRVLFDRLPRNLQQSMVARAREVISTPGIVDTFRARLSERIIQVTVTDLAGGEKAVNFDAQVFNGPRLVEGRMFVEHDEDGLYRFYDHKRGETVVVYNPILDSSGDVQSAISASAVDGSSLDSLPSNIMLRALFASQLYGRGLRTTLLPNVRIDGHPDFEGGVTYAGYSIPNPESGSWIPLGDFISNAIPVEDEHGRAAVVMLADGSAIRLGENELGFIIAQHRGINYTAKKVGVDMDFADVTWVNLDTADVRVVLDAPVQVIDAEMLANGHGKIYDHRFPKEEDLLNYRAAYVSDIPSRSLVQDGLNVSVYELLVEASKSGEIGRGLKVDPSNLVGSYLDVMGIHEAHRRLEAKLEGGPRKMQLEMIAFHDIVSGYIEEGLQVLAGIRPIANVHQTYRAIIRSMQSNLIQYVMPPITRDEKVLTVYERGRVALRTFLSDPSKSKNWENLFAGFLSEHGTAQVSMYCAMVLPYLAACNQNNPARFFKAAGQFVEMFRPNQDVLSWVHFENAVHNGTSPGGGNTPTGTEDPSVDDVSIGGEVVDLLSFSGSKTTSVGAVPATAFRTNVVTTPGVKSF